MQNFVFIACKCRGKLVNLHKILSRYARIVSTDGEILSLLTHLKSFPPLITKTKQELTLNLSNPQNQVNTKVRKHNPSSLSLLSMLLSEKNH